METLQLVEEELIKQWQPIFDYSTDLISIFNHVGTMIKINHAWQVFFEMSESELLEKDFIEIVHPDDIESTKEIFEELFNTEEVIKFINRFRKSNGEYRYIEWHAKANHQFAIATGRDITEKIELEEQLRLTNERLNLALHSTQDGFSDWDLVSDQVFYSDQWFALLGYKPSDFQHVSSVFNELVYDEDVLMVVQTMEQFILSEETTITIEFRMKHRAGHIVWIEGKALAIKDEQGKTIRLIGSTSDISMVKKLQQQIEADKDFFKSMMESTSDSVWIYNISQAKFTYVSSNNENFKLSPSANVHDLKFSDVVLPKDVLTLVSVINKGVNDLNKNPKEVVKELLELQLPLKDQTLVWVEVSLHIGFNAVKEMTVLAVNRIIENRMLAQKQIDFFTYHDSLTGLFNRRKYEDDLLVLDHESNYPLAIIVIDVNGLKMANDAFGHKHGDYLIKKAAKSFSKAFDTPYQYRIGGDEFILMLPNTSNEVVEFSLSLLDSYLYQQPQDLNQLSLSYGYSMKVEKDISLEYVFKTAEINMYHHKTKISDDYRTQIIKRILKSLFDLYKWEQGHSIRVSKLCALVGHQLGLDDYSLNQLELAGMYHDIGKIAIEPEILNSVCPHNESEMAIARRHAEIGFYLLRACNKFADVAEIVLHSHERVDGSGYPKGLTKHEISLKSQILGIVEAYDAMMCEIPGCVTFTKEQALDEIGEQSGIQFDQSVVNALLIVEKSAN